MPNPSPAALLRRWISGAVTPEDRQRTCVALCMDFRYGEHFHGCYQAANAGPRCDDTARSLDYLVRLTPEDLSLVALWLTHNGLCGCSRVETGSDDPAVVEPHTAETRRREAAALLSPDGSGSLRFREAVASGRALLVTGHVDVTMTPRSTRLLIGETQEILRACDLPELPGDLFDITLPSQ